MTTTEDVVFETRSLIKVPKTPADFLPPRASSMVSEMAALLRNEEHWTEIEPFLSAIAGATAPINGSARYDEAACIFKTQEICKRNGYTLLANANAAQLSKVFKFAYRRNTGQTVRMLQKQGSQLRLEDKRTSATAAE